MFFAFACFGPLPNYCEAACHTLFSSVFHKSLQFFQQPKRRRRAKTLSKDPLMYHCFDVIWHHGMSSDFWSRIHMLWPPIILQWTPRPVYNLRCLLERGLCSFFEQLWLWIVFFGGIQLQPQGPFRQPSIPKQYFHLNILQLCFFQRCDPATWTQEFELSFLSAVSLAAYIKDTHHVSCKFNGR